MVWSKRRGLVAFTLVEFLTVIVIMGVVAGTLCKFARVECVRFVAPAPLGKRRSRDVKDEPYLACALAASAEAIVSNDSDLLDPRNGS